MAHDKLNDEKILEKVKAMQDDPEVKKFKEDEIKGKLKDYEGTDKFKELVDKKFNELKGPSKTTLATRKENEMRKEASKMVRENYEATITSLVEKDLEPKIREMARLELEKERLGEMATDQMARLREDEDKEFTDLVERNDTYKQETANREWIESEQQFHAAKIAIDKRSEEYLATVEAAKYINAVWNVCNNFKLNTKDSSEIKLLNKIMDMCQENSVHPRIVQSNIQKELNSKAHVLPLYQRIINAVKSFLTKGVDAAKEAFHHNKLHRKMNEIKDEMERSRKEEADLGSDNKNPRALK